MKKLIGIMAVGLLLFGFAGQSMATTAASAGFFAAGDLIRVVYDTSYNALGVPTGGTYETATDLGSVGSLTALTATTVVGDNFTQFTNPAAYNTLQVAYFVESGSITSSSSPLYIGSTSATQPTPGSSASTLNGGMSNVLITYGNATLLGTDSIQIKQSATNSYWGIMDASVPGSFSQFIGGGLGESGLASLATGGNVQESLYGYYEGPGRGSNPITEGVLKMNNGQTLDVETFVNGSGQGESEIVVEGAPVPIPPSLLLLAPGLFGLIGLRKKVR